LQASLAAARQQVQILKANYEQATANVSGLTAQVAYNKKRLTGSQTLATDDANSQFQAQDKQVQYETVSAQLAAAKAAQQTAKRVGWVERSETHHVSACSEGMMGSAFALPILRVLATVG
jgi:multidrug resistance efflux pump